MLNYSQKEKTTEKYIERSENSMLSKVSEFFEDYYELCGRK